MRAALLRTAREQFTPTHVLAVAAVLGLLRFVVDVSRDAFVGVVVALAIGEVVTLLRNTPTVDQRYVNGGIGLVVVAGCLVLGYGVATGGPGALWLPALLLPFGVWILVDTVTAFARGDEPTPSSDDLSSADVMLLVSHAHLVTSALEDGPRTIDELVAACDLTESRVERTLDYLTESGVVVTEGDRYVLDETQTGLVAFVRNLVAGVIARLARPFRASS